MPRKKKTRHGKHKTLLDYFSKFEEPNKQVANGIGSNPTGSNNKSAGKNMGESLEKRVSEKTLGVEPGGSSPEQIDQSTKNQQVEKNNKNELLELLSILETGKKKTNKQVENMEDFKPSSVSFLDKNINIAFEGSIIDVDLGQLRLPTGKILEEIFEKGLGKDDVTCYNNGKCSDGVSIGETYTDKYGFLRQRGYINTTRLPVYMDWIVEEGIVKPILERAYGLKTNRGAVALIPEDYLCELQLRYGIKLLNFDKCKGHKSIVEWGIKTTRRKRRK
ncbi:hypothetical protein [Staphylothermus hellenicus]|uniref:Uncharacterized protein n=1 Tax=Staphylothermus hellenicus (strain DSM 12710 / JCM 10830 / BK20S6-10-b1 / P8) TaxID=591019 RepID=D7DBV5_STAHD|nr:hypothetical protein [Staphylothermus hellenicus]ADI31652.1 hypothetical protein Shell_0521 [Staphylothermus hellenicus DSM 12710]